MVRVHGELWRATSKDSLPEGTRVRVRRVEGLKLDVEQEVAAVASRSGD
jgi:membrane protein implicated in regulation of membrane protease activity